MVRQYEKIPYISSILRGGVNLQYIFQYLESSWVVHADDGVHAEATRDASQRVPIRLSGQVNKIKGEVSLGCGSQPLPVLFIYTQG